MNCVNIHLANHASYMKIKHYLVIDKVKISPAIFFSLFIGKQICPKLINAILILIWHSAQTLRI